MPPLKKNAPNYCLPVHPTLTLIPRTKGRKGLGTIGEAGGLLSGIDERKNAKKNEDIIASEGRGGLTQGEGKLSKGATT